MRADRHSNFVDISVAVKCVTWLVPSLIAPTVIEGGELTMPSTLMLALDCSRTEQRPETMVSYPVIENHAGKAPVTNSFYEGSTPGPDTVFWSGRNTGTQWEAGTTATLVWRSQYVRIIQDVQ